MKVTIDYYFREIIQEAAWKLHINDDDYVDEAIIIATQIITASMISY